MPSHILVHSLLLVPLNYTPTLRCFFQCLPPSHRRLVPPGCTVELEESGSDPEAQSCWNCCPIPRHTCIQRKPLLLANQRTPPNVHCLPPPRTPHPRWGPGLGLCPGPVGCPLQLPLHTKPALWPASPNSGGYDKGAPPPSPTGRPRTGHRGRREKAAPRWCPPQEVSAADGPPPHPEPPDLQGAGPRPPARLCSRRKRRLGPARYSRCPRGGPGWVRGGSPHPLPLCAPTWPRAARPGCRPGPGASLPAAPNPRP